MENKKYESKMVRNIATGAALLGLALIGCQKTNSGNSQESYRTQPTKTYAIDSAKTVASIVSEDTNNSGYQKIVPDPKVVQMLRDRNAKNMRHFTTQTLTLREMQSSKYEYLQNMVSVGLAGFDIASGTFEYNQATKEYSANDRNGNHKHGRVGTQDAKELEQLIAEQ